MRWRFLLGAFLFGVVARVKAAPWRLGIEAGAGLAHELAGLDLTLRLGHVGVFIPFGPFGIENVFLDGAPTVAGGIRFYSGDGEGLVLTLQGAGVWTPRSRSAVDAGIRAAVAVTAGYCLRVGQFFAQAAAGPVWNDNHGWSFGSMEHRRNWYRSSPVDLDAALGFEF